MYNEKVKRRFIEDYYKTDVRKIKAAEYLFNQTQKYEEDIGEDLATLSLEQVEPILSDVMGIRDNSKRSRQWIAEDYAKWCLKNKIPNANDNILNANIDLTQRMKKRMLANPQHLQNFLDTVCDPVSEETVDCVFRCLCWLIYSGISLEDDLLKIKSINVDMNDLIVNFKSNDYIIYREAISSFKKCLELDSFVVDNPLYKDTVRMDRIAGDELLRKMKGLLTVENCRNCLSRKNVIYRSVAKKNNTPQFSLSFDRIYLSGIFYRLYEAERAGMPIDFSAITVQMIESKGQKEQDITPERKHMRFLTKRRDLEIDYSVWKSAFCG